MTISRIPYLITHVPCPVSRNYVRDSQRNSYANNYFLLKLLDYYYYSLYILLYIIEPIYNIIYYLNK